MRSAQHVGGAAAPPAGLPGLHRVAGLGERQQFLPGRAAVVAAVAGRPCASCGRARGRKDTRHIVLRTLFGTLRLESPRYKACPCAAGGPATVSPVAARAHLLLQVRTRVLNADLAADLARWYPGLGTPDQRQLVDAA